MRRGAWRGGEGAGTPPGLRGARGRSCPGRRRGRRRHGANRTSSSSGSGRRRAGWSSEACVEMLARWGECTQQNLRNEQILMFIASTQIFLLELESSVDYIWTLDVRSIRSVIVIIASHLVGDQLGGMMQ